MVKESLIELTDANLIKYTHREKAPLNKTSMLSKSINMAIWLVGTSNTGKTPLFIIAPFYTP